MRTNDKSTPLKLLLSSGAAFGALLMTQPAWAQSEPGVEETEFEEIVVLGTRRTDRSATDSASPIDIISAQELVGQPAADMLDVIKNIVPSFYVPQNTISDASTFVRAPSLRGLGADQILVMINGKRYNRSALVQVVGGGDTALSLGAQSADISMIPAIAIANLQILRDGATAQYGSDAIGGVINYGIRSSDSGLEVLTQYGQNYAGDGESYQVAANAGFSLWGNGFVNLSGEYFKGEQTSRGATRPVAAVFAASNPSLASQLPNFPGPVQIWGSSPTDGYKLFLNSGYDLTANSSLYLTVNVGHREADQSFNYRSPISATGLVIDNGTGTPATGSPGRNGAFNPIFLTPCPTGNATCPTGGFVRNTNTFSFASIYPAGFTPRFQGVADQAYGTFGTKGEADSGLTYDLSATLAENSLELAMTQSLNASFGPQSQTSFEFGQLIQREANLNLDLTYPLEVGFASPITLSGGVEHRREEYEQTAGDLQSYAAGPYAVQSLYRLVSPGVYVADGSASQSPGASGYGGTRPESAKVTSQTSYGVYVGAEADVTEALSVGVMGRYEDYSTFGDTFVGKVNALYEVSDMFSVRGTVGSGFHAPSPGQGATEILTTAFAAGNQVQTGTYPVSSPISQFFGAKTLTPEESVNFGAGFILKPIPALTLTVDAYLIEVTDRISITSTFNVTAANIVAQPALAAVGVGGAVNYFTNGFDTETKGIDAVASYRTELLENPLSLTLAYSYNKSEVTDFDPVVIGADRIFDIENITPKHRAIVSANWQVAGFTVNGRANYYSSWASEQDYPGQVFGDKVTADLDVSYTIADAYTITVGASNLFDEYPDKIAGTTANPIYALTGSTADGQIYPRSGGPFGMNGGFWFARLSVKY
ncbi:Vitamin B12 transporter BtuB [Brevundimonas sp. NIBR10]|uniref:TonB-dependent receptor plug domain-containing protein n=1 Tax=Brevundimonas sp. NIBR10 TaxID=3015997 RepID=UPI0022F1C4F4|nr:TonB-dependent receptor [Brevundimonas sp. NIBR10]WGM48378.1 Vitamin B12 transporter BtuB [Brevundimonas sp. NIBR10]